MYAFIRAFRTLREMLEIIDESPAGTTSEVKLIRRSQVQALPEENSRWTRVSRWTEWLIHSKTGALRLRRWRRYANPSLSLVFTPPPRDP